jgi:hypothetical protein
MRILGWKAAEPQNICHAELDGAKGAHRKNNKIV